MADEAFALSPISARATLPGEEDYAAIAEAFMETSRGRWFLTEYAKRNRNADTRMVLDAVARIEQSLTTQREEAIQREAALHRDDGLSAQQAAEAVARADAAQERLTEALAAIRHAVDETEESAVEALDSLALEQRLAPVRKGARVLREIAWRLREIGNDGRICDLIDSQVTVIERSTDQLSPAEAEIALRAAFSALQGRLMELRDPGDPAAPPEVIDAAPAPEMPEAAAFEIEPEPEAAAPVAVAEVPPAPEAAVVHVEAPAAIIPQAPPPVEPATPTAAPETAVQFAAPDIAAEHEAYDEEPASDADAQDDALLDVIAMEMGAPDPINDNEISEAATEQARLAEIERNFAAALAADERSRPAATLPLAIEESVAPPPPPPPPAPAPAMDVSLGASIIASGMLRRPVSAANDPLAPIRRMSQAEKIAFFS